MRAIVIRRLNMRAALDRGTYRPAPAVALGAAAHALREARLAQQSAALADYTSVNQHHRRLTRAPPEEYLAVASAERALTTGVAASSKTARGGRVIGNS